MRMKKFPKQTKLLVTWDDITTDASWGSAIDIKRAKTTRVHTVGFFLKNKKRELTIAHSISEDGDSDYTCIPWGCIKNIVELVRI